MTAVATRVDSVAFFDRLAETMNGQPERYEHLGDIDLDLSVVMNRADGDPFGVRLRFEGITCAFVGAIDGGDEANGDCWLEGDLAEWEAMFANIGEHDHATGQWTLNTLTLFGTGIRLLALDPMGEDRFHRFNQTLQEFVDGAASVALGEE